jgi:hypothetical protein
MNRRLPRQTTRRELLLRLAGTGASRHRDAFGNAASLPRDNQARCKAAQSTLAGGGCPGKCSRRGHKKKSSWPQSDVAAFNAQKRKRPRIKSAPPLNYRPGPILASKSWGFGRSRRPIVSAEIGPTRTQPDTLKRRSPPARNVHRRGVPCLPRAGDRRRRSQVC